MVKKKLLTRKGFGKTDLKVKGMYLVRVSIKLCKVRVFIAYFLVAELTLSTKMAL